MDGTGRGADWSGTARETARELESLRGLADRFGESLTRAFARGITQGQEFDSILQGLGRSLVEMGLRAAFAPLQTLVGGALGGLAQGIPGAAGVTGFAQGGVISRGLVTPFAQGGRDRLARRLPARPGPRSYGRAWCRGRDAARPRSGWPPRRTQPGRAAGLRDGQHRDPGHQRLPALGGPTLRRTRPRGSAGAPGIVRRSRAGATLIPPKR